MEPIQIFDHIKQQHFEVYVPQEVAERCRIDNVFADDLYRQIKDQSIEEGSALEIETQLVDQAEASVKPSTLGRQKGWSNQEILKLLKSYSKFKKRLQQSPTAAFWSKISEELNKQNFYKSAGQCRDKWRTLKKRYKNALETGLGSKFIFFNKIDSVIKSLQSRNDDFDRKEALQESSDEYFDQDLDSSISIRKKGFWAWTKPGSKESGESRQFWSNPEIHIFLKMLYKHKDSRKLCKSSYKFWSLLSEELSKVLIKKNPRQCWRKWKNLLFTYRRVNEQIINNPALIVRFPFYEEVKRIVSNENHEEDGTEGEDDDDYVVAVSGEDSLIEEMQTDENNRLWTDDHTSALIDVYKANMKDYNKFEFKKQFWEHIANLLNTKGYPETDAEQCKNLWKTLLKCYNDHSDSKDNNFIFIQALESVFKDIQEPEAENKLPSLGVADEPGTCEQIIIETEDKEIQQKTTHKEDLWSYEESIALIDMFNNHKNQLNNNEFQNLRFWGQISASLKANGIHKSSEDCEKQWNTLYNTYLKRKKLNVADSEFLFAKHIERVFEPPQELKIEIISDNENYVNGSQAPCSCAEKIIAERKLRHKDRMNLLKRKLDIEERRVKAFEEYIKHLKNNS